MYVVKKGDTLYSIARQYNLSVAALQRWNNLDTAVLSIGQRLRLVPPATASPALEPLARPEPKPYGRYVLRPGDTLVNVALWLGTTVDTLRMLTDVAPLGVGDTLRLPPRFARPTHLVQPDETLYAIAGQYGVSTRVLQTANALDTTAVRAGQRLIIPGRPAQRPPRGTLAPPDTTGAAAIYPAAYAGRLMASGQPYQPSAFVGSHRTLPLGSLVLVSANDAHAFVRIADRGPLQRDRVMDVSRAVADAINLQDGGPIALRYVWQPPR